jgi:hypothetical protein
MVNPFKSGDKVMIFRKGVEIEATVRTTWNHEVQVKTGDGELLWRTVKTAWLVTDGGAAQSVAVPTVIEGVAEVIHPEAPMPEQEPAPEVLEEAVSPELEPESLPLVEEALVEQSEEVAVAQPSDNQPTQPGKGTRRDKKRRKGSNR